MVVNFCFFGYGQNSDVLLPDMLQADVCFSINRNYARECRSLFTNNLEEVNFKEFAIRNLSNKKIKLGKLNKPVFILSYASSCEVRKEDVSEINQLAEAHDDDLQLLIFFWGSKDDLERTSRLFHKKIQICSTEFKSEKNRKWLQSFKNDLEKSMSFYVINSNQKVRPDYQISDAMTARVSLEELIATSRYQFRAMIDLDVLQNNAKVYSVVGN